MRISRLMGERERRDELLSAYLDGELGDEGEARLEAQMVSDPALQAELEALRQAVALVRDLPPVPTPRNFILPQTVTARPQAAPPKQPRRARSLSLLTVATIVVSLVFAVVLGGDILRLSAPGPQMAHEAPPGATAEMAFASAPESSPPEASASPGAVMGEGIAPADGSITPEATLAEGKENGGVRQYSPEETTVPPALVGGRQGTPESIKRPVVLEIALGLAALTLAAFTVRAWLHRR